MACKTREVLPKAVACVWNIQENLSFETSVSKESVGRPWQVLPQNTMIRSEFKL